MTTELIELILLIAIIGVLLISEACITMTYNNYSKENANLDLTGQNIVENMLSSNGINNVRLGKTKGTLDDHYNSKTKVINLSKNSYQTNTIAAIAVAAHETGHAIQDHTNYFMLRIRKFLGPITSFCSRFVWIAILLGLIMELFDLIVLGLVLMGVTILFQLVTLPVEFDASRRAVAYLETVGYNNETMAGIKKMLKAAALTYIASTVASLMQMIRFIIKLTRNN